MDNPSNNRPSDDETPDEFNSEDEQSTEDDSLGSDEPDDESTPVEKATTEGSVDKTPEEPNESSKTRMEQRKSAAPKGFDKAPGKHPNFPAPNCQWYHYTTTFRLAMVAVVSVALLLVSLGGVLAHAEWKKRQAVHAVTDFLQAIHDKDIAAATEHLTELRIDDVEREPFLTEEALNSAWSIGDAHLVQFRPEKRQDTAIVEAAIVSTEGVQVSHEFSLFRAGTVWKIDNPFSHKRFPSRLSGDVEINGVSATPGSETDEMFAFFPGVYEYFEVGPAFMGTTFDSMLKLGSAQSFLSADGELEDLEPTSSDETDFVLHYLQPAEGFEEDINEQIERHLDNCIENIRSELPWSCPFSRGTLAIPEDLNLEENRDESAGWEILEYPEVSLMLDIDNYPREIVSLTNLTDGVVEVLLPVMDTATNASQELTFHCNINVEGIQPVHNDDGSVEMTHNDELVGYSKLIEPVCNSVDD